MTSDSEPLKVDPVEWPAVTDEPTEDESHPVAPADDGSMSRLTVQARAEGRDTEPSITVQHAHGIRDGGRVKVWFSATDRDGNTVHVALAKEEAAALARYTLDLCELPWGHGVRLNFGKDGMPF